ncbi:hypothetical protein [Arcticibacter sp. MXS-1]|uniref:hypothetical protein n=1 Tax=Arcticibacter sp. MXS-1 TaxID=3341726 RepID=UPI0035A9A8BD
MHKVIDLFRGGPVDFQGRTVLLFFWAKAGRAPANTNEIKSEAAIFERYLFIINRKAYEISLYTVKRGCTWINAGYKIGYF